MQDLIQSSAGSLVSCRVELDGQACHVHGDPTQLELAILNLVINARDAMPNGGSLTLSTRRTRVEAGDVVLCPGDYVELAIGDTGVGMPPEILRRAMDPFFTTKGVGAGTGLGLSMAFGVATQSGGTLRIGSRVGEGTTVSILLPCKAPPPVDLTAPAAPAAPGPAEGLPGRRIAVVDDDPDVRQFVVDCLTSHGAVCQAFDGGEAFLAAFAESRPDVILLDFAMPGLSGVEAARRAMQIDPTAPIVMMTGYADSDALDEILGDIDLIRKPFSVEVLLAAAVKAAAAGRRPA